MTTALSTALAALRIVGGIMSTPAGTTTIFLTWSALMIAAAYWARWDAPIWSAF